MELSGSAAAKGEKRIEWCDAGGRVGQKLFEEGDENFRGTENDLWKVFEEHRKCVYKVT